eukprot:sb/3469219/
MLLPLLFLFCLVGPSEASYWFRRSGGALLGAPIDSDDNVVTEVTGDAVVADVLTVDVVDAKLEALKAELEEKINRLDMLIKFYNPGWGWTPSRECGIDCPYNVDVTQYQAVQWQVDTQYMDGIFDLEFVDEKGWWYGNMDFYDSHMWLRGCGWVEYITAAPLPKNGTIRTWAYSKTGTGFQLWCERTLLVDFTYTEGRCMDVWGGSTIGFFFETQPQGVHLLQHGGDMFWWDNQGE